MDYISVKEAAERWGLSRRHVQRFVADGRIRGAQKYGTVWMIPSDAKKPVDPRKERKAPESKSCPYLACGLISALIPMPSDGPDRVLERLPDDAQRRQYAAELAYLRGDLEAVKAYYAQVSPRDSHYLCAANIAGAAAMGSGDYTLFSEIKKSLDELTKSTDSEETKAVASLFTTMAAVSMYVPAMAPDWVKRGDCSAFPRESLPFLIHMRVKYLQITKQYEAMLATAETALNLQRRAEEFTLSDLYLLTFCACAYYAMGNHAKTRECLDKTLDMAMPWGLLAPLSECATSVGGMLVPDLQKRSKKEYDALLCHLERTLNNWLFFHNKYAKVNITTVLSTREYQIAILLNEGKTYAEAAQHMNISVGRLKNIVSVIYGKLHIKTKKEIGEFLL